MAQLKISGVESDAFPAIGNRKGFLKQATEERKTKMLTEEAERHARTRLANKLAENKMKRAKDAEVAEQKAKEETAAKAAEAEAAMRNSFVRALMANPSCSREDAERLWRDGGRDDTLRALGTKATEREQMARESYKRKIARGW
jgi:hypothetical protein